MKQLRPIAFLSLIFLLIACNNQGRTDRDDDRTAEERVTGEPRQDWDRLMDDWDDRWNQNDANAVEELFAQDALLLFDGEETASSKIREWINDNAQTMRNLQSQASAEGSGEDFAYHAGTYSHGDTENDTLQGEGAFTIIWERRNNAWKAKVITISPRHEQDTLRVDEENRTGV